MKRAIVIGAGIAGPVTAMALLRSGFSPVVHEARSEAAATGGGAWLTLAVNGLRALRVLDLDRRVAAVGFPTGSITLASGSGRELGTVSLGPELDGTVTHSLRRGELAEVLVAEAQRRGVGFVFGRRLVDVLTRADGQVVARFADGSEAVGDVLIGADGVHSVTRRVLDPRAPEPRVSGMGNVAGFVPDPPVHAPPGTYQMIFGRRAFFGYVAHPSGEVWWFANPPWPAPDASAEWLAGLFEGDAGPAAELIRATPHPLRFFDQHTLPRVPTWRRGSAILIGDAAHAASPTSGQGASLAVEDGVELARCLRDLPVAEALGRFEALRRARVERVVREAEATSTHKVPGPLGRWLRDLVLPMFLARAARDPRSWLFEHAITWDEPVS